MKNRNIVNQINTDEFSNVVLGLENENIFEAVSNDDEIEVLEDMDAEIETQLDEDDAFKDMLAEDSMIEEEAIEDEWSTVEEDINRANATKPEDCINLMELVSGYTNNYRKNMVEIDKIMKLEPTGDFKLYNSFEDINKVMETLDYMLTDVKYPAMDTLKQAKKLIMSAPKMASCCGTTEAPFLYRGLQVAYITQLHTMLMVAPYTLKLQETFEIASEAVGLDKNIKMLDRVLKSFTESEDMIGTKIKFKDSVTNNLTGRSEEISETVYANSDIIDNREDIVTTYESAGESIANLMEIKANRALLNYNQIIRDLSLLTEYLISGIKMYDHFIEIRTSVSTLLETDDATALEGMVTETCKDLDKMIVTTNSAYKRLLVKK